MLPSIFLLFTLAVGALAGRAGLGSRYNKNARETAIQAARLRSRAQPHNFQKRAGLIAPKFFIISLFTSEADTWYTNMPSITDQNIAVPGLSPLYPDVHCTAAGDVCQMTAGEGGYNAGSSMSGLIYSGLFNLTETYFMIAGIAGINPHVATTGSVTFSKYVVQVDLQYVFDSRQIPANFSSGFIPQDNYYPDETNPIDYPGDLYGTEVFELNAALRTRFVSLARNATLNDSSSANAYRKTYGYAPANQPPSVVECVSATSNIYWSGSTLGTAFSAYTKLLTNGSGTYCATQQEDNAVLEALLRGDLSGQVDFSRVQVMRTASDFDRAPPDETEVFHLLDASQHGFTISIENIFIAGNAIITHVVDNWDSVYKKGLKPTNYIGDVFNSLNGPIKPDIGDAANYLH